MSTTPAETLNLENLSVMVTAFGGYDCLTVRNSDAYALPETEAITVHVKYGGVNFADIYMRQGLLRTFHPPFVLGLECFGTIVAIGRDCCVGDDDATAGALLKVGDRVICYDHTGGLHRQIVRMRPSHCYAVPDWVSDEDAAALFVNYLTAYFALHPIGALRANGRVLITSCAGGVGWAATQLAKALQPGVCVAGTCSPAKQALVRQNGVDEVLLNATTAEDATGKYDLIVADVIGAELQALQAKLRDLGRIVLIGAKNLIEGERKVSILRTWLMGWRTRMMGYVDLINSNTSVGGLHLGLLVDRDPQLIRDTLNTLYEMLRTERIKPRVHQIVPVERTVEAAKLMIDRMNVGKLLLSMEKEPTDAK